MFKPEQGSLNTTKPKRFNQVHGIHSIIDGSEIFIETPKNLDLQELTWSEYMRILVEQVIRQIKTFIILLQEFSIPLLSSVDGTVIICCALCNLLPPIFKD